MRRHRAQLAGIAFAVWSSSLLTGLAGTATAIDLIRDGGEKRVEDHSGSCVGSQCSEGSIALWLVAVVIVLALIALIVASRRRAR